MPTQILLLTGMTPDARIFERIMPLVRNACVVPWIDPHHDEPLADYVTRLSRSIVVTGDVIVCGVSFGGIVARELALRLDARACVLISSIRSPRQLPPWIRMLRPLSAIGKQPMLNLVGTTATIFPARMRTNSTARLGKLAGARGAWHRWATSAVLSWNPSGELDRVPVVQIHGDQDTTFPIRYVDADLIVPGGGHVLPLTHAETIARHLTELATNEDGEQRESSAGVKRC